MMLLRASNDTLFIIAICVAMLLVIAFFSVYLFFLFQKRKIRLIQQQQLIRANYEQELLKTQIEIRDHTMSDVGLELHDHISQVMTLVKINMDLLSGKGLGETDEKRLTGTKDLVKETIQDIRALSRTLNGDLIQDVGLIGSIQNELDRIGKLRTFDCQLKITGEQYPIPANIAFIVFRILQENLHNIIKHAKCKSVFTQLDFTGAGFTLTQKENGIGFDLSKASNNNNADARSGLLNMRRRAAMIDAILSIESSPGEGSLLTIKVNK